MMTDTETKVSKELINDLHMDYWLKLGSGPMMDDMVDARIWYTLRNREVRIEISPDEIYTYQITSGELHKKLVKYVEKVMGTGAKLGSVKFIEYYIEGSNEYSVATYLGEGTWLTETGLALFSDEVFNIWEVDIEVSAG